MLTFEPVPFPNAAFALTVNGKQARQKLSAQLNHGRHRNVVRLAPKKSTCVVPPMHVQWLMSTRTLLSPPQVLPNWALNRTHCGRLAFGLQKPSPNAIPPQ